ncbi:MAG: hypothetical protein JNJ54_12770 [Myxococcaceae bacterium]|nr:hypothetical protein [Myxococcaceae bacterium]
MSDDATEELKRRVEAQQAAARRDVERRSRTEGRRHEKALRRRAEKLEGARRAPAGFFRSMRFWGLAFAGLLMLVALLVIVMEGDPATQARYLAPFAVIWLIAFAVLWVDSATWRQRLPFVVEGDLEIEGEDRTGDSEVPWIAVKVEIVLAQGGSHEAVGHTLQLLASRANRLLADDKEARFGGAQVWRPGQSQVAGETDPSFWTTRVLERWLRNEVRLLHRGVPVAKVKVHARYTGSGYRISTD